MTTFTTPINQISSLYVGYFGRAGDPAGENYWISQLNAGTVSLSGIAASFSVQPESTAKYPYLANPTINDPGVFVDQVYQNMFNHTADAAGKAYWVAQLNSAKGNPSAIGSMILNIISGATGTDSTTISNKVDVASDFVTKAANAGTTFNASYVSQSSTELSSVTDTAASVTAAKLATDVYIASAPGPQQNFTLGLDNLTSSAQNANFNASLVFNPGTGTQVQSLQTGDSAVDSAPLTGPGLSNGGTLTAILNSGAVTPLVTLQGIPTHTDTSVAAGSGYSGNITGLVNLNNGNSTGSLTIGALGIGIDKGGVAGTTTTGATLLSSVNIANVAGTTATAATTVFVNTAALAGAADVVAINVAGTFGTGPTTLATANTVSVKNDTAAAGATDNAYETINLNVAGTTNIALADAGSGILSTTTLNVASLGSVTIWSEATEAHFSKLTTINASAQVGGLTVTGASSAGGFLTGSVLTSFKGGLGVDSVDLSSMTGAQVAAMTAGNLDGGIGRDTLILSSAAATAGLTFNNSNIEIIGITGLTGTVDFSKYGAGVDTFSLVSAQTGAATFNNLASGLTVALGANATGFAETFNGPTAPLTDTIAVTSTGTAAGIGAEIFTGFETITETISAAAVPLATAITSITATPSAGGSTIFNLIDNNGTGSLTITGATNLGTAGTLNVSGTGTGGVVVGATITAGAINASGLNTGASATTVGFNMATFGTAAASTILGSAGLDTLNGSAAADTISGGAGNDVIQNMLTGTGGVGVADVLNGGTGNDQFKIRGDVAGAGAPPAVYGTVTSVGDFTVGTSGTATDFISVTFTAGDYAVFGATLKNAAAIAQGSWGVQNLSNGAGAVAILDNTAAGAAFLKLTTGVAAGATLNATFNSAIGTTQVTGITKSKSYFFAMYDTTNSKMDIGIVSDTAADTTIKSGDTVALIASVSMSAADYANINTNHFSLIA